MFANTLALPAYKPPRLEMLDVGGTDQEVVLPPSVIVVIVAMVLVVALGAWAICFQYGYSGVAFKINLNRWNVKLGCYK